MADYANTIATLLDSTERVMMVEFADKTVPIKRRKTIFYLHFWWILTKWNEPVTSEYVLTETAITNKSIANMYTRIYNAILKSQNTTQAQYDLWTSINVLHNFVIAKCAAYHSSISILELCQLLEEPRVKAITDSVHFDTDTQTSVVEQQMAVASRDMIELLRDKTLPNNVLYSYHKLGLLNTMQIPQMMIAIGTRTDINDMLIKYPINASFIHGLTNEIEYMCESLSAKKAAVYAKAAIPLSQYFSRRQHLVTSALSYIYKGDCGTHVIVPYFVHEKVAHNLVGKYYLTDGGLSEITKDNCKSLIGRTVQFRSPIGCRYKDGICEICGGAMVKYLAEDAKLGIASAIEVTDPTTQKILSAKHLQITNSLMYTPPDDLMSLLLAKRDQIYWRKNKANLIKTFKLGIAMSDMQHISDLSLMTADAAINEEHFSQITKMVIHTIDGNEPITNVVDMAKGKMYPYFSKDMLIYLRDNYESLEIGEIIWIPLDKFDTSKPIFKSLIQNDSMIEFVSAVESFLKSKISTYTSATEALKDFSNVIYSKVETNILHLEVMLKAYLIVDELNYGVTEVTDTEQVKFGNDMTINVNRSLGGFLAFQEFFESIRSPKTYVVPRNVGPFDTYVGFSDEIKK